MAEQTTTSAPTKTSEQSSHVEVIDAQTQRIGPFEDKESGELSTYEIHLDNFTWTESNGQSVITISIRIKNLGPTGTRIMNQFYLVDQGGSTGSYSQIDTGDCGFKSEVFLLKDGISQQCIAFSGAKANELSLIFAPYSWQQFNEGRYAAFKLESSDNTGGLFNPIMKILVAKSRPHAGKMSHIPYTLIDSPQIGQKLS